MLDKAIIDTERLIWLILEWNLMIPCPLSFTEDIESTGIIDSDDVVQYFIDGECKQVVYKDIDRLPIYEKDSIMAKVKNLK